MHRGRPQQASFLATFFRNRHMSGIILGLLCSLTFAAITGILVAIFLADQDLEGQAACENVGSSRTSSFTVLGSRRKPETLVLYSFSHTDFAYHHNLLYYLRHGVHEDDGCHHMIIINNSLKSPTPVHLPPLPENAEYVFHKNECFDWGTFGWVLRQKNITAGDYRHYIFLNSSVRGPFIPSYLQGRVHFSELMTTKLSDDVKLVGPSINCEGSQTIQGDLSRSNPHVQSFAVATDQVGLQVLIDDQNVFGCYDTIAETIYHSELGSSAAILRAGYNIDSFMGRYQGVDWRNELNWACNGQENPFNSAPHDTIGLHPMELMFVKVKHYHDKLKYPSVAAALQYDKWQLDALQGRQEVLSNDFYERVWDHRAARILAAAAKGDDCFDCEFYRARNHDLRDHNCIEAFSHFVNEGQFEARAHRFFCQQKAEEHGVPFQPPSQLKWPNITASTCMYMVSDPEEDLVDPDDIVNAPQLSRSSQYTHSLEVDAEIVAHVEPGYM